MDRKPIININRVLEDLRLAAQPLPILVKGEIVSDIKNTQRRYNDLLASLLTFDRSSFPKKISSKRFERRMNDMTIQAVLATRNEYTSKLAHALERLAESYSKKHDFMTAIIYLQDAIRFYKRSNYVPVVVRVKNSEQHYDQRVDMDAEFTIRILGLQQKILDTAIVAFCSKKSTKYHSELIRYAVSAAGHIVEQNGSLSSLDQRLTKLAEIIAPAILTGKSFKSDIITALTELIKALLYGVAANGLWHFYSKFVMMDPGRSSESIAKKRICDFIYENLEKHISETLVLADIEEFNYVMLNDIISEIAVNRYIGAWFGFKKSSRKSNIKSYSR